MIKVNPFITHIYHPDFNHVHVCNNFPFVVHVYFNLLWDGSLVSQVMKLVSCFISSYRMYLERCSRHQEKIRKRYRKSETISRDLRTPWRIDKALTLVVRRLIYFGGKRSDLLWLYDVRFTLTVRRSIFFDGKKSHCKKPNRAWLSIVSVAY